MTARDPTFQQMSGRRALAWAPGPEQGCPGQQGRLESVLQKLHGREVPGSSCEMHFRERSDFTLQHPGFIFHIHVPCSLRKPAAEQKIFSQ